MQSNVDRTEDYKGFTVRAFKTDNGFWRADITRTAGGKMKTVGYKELLDLIQVPRDSITPEKALEEARRLIDAGGIS